INTQGKGLGESSNAESPQGNANQPTRLDDHGAQVRGIVSTRPKPQTTTGAVAEYLTAGQIAELLQVSEKSVYRWAAGDPTFPMLKIGGTVRLPPRRLGNWLHERQQGVGGPRMREKGVAAPESRAGEGMAGGWGGKKDPTQRGIKRDEVHFAAKGSRYFLLRRHASSASENQSATSCRSRSARRAAPSRRRLRSSARPRPPTYRRTASAIKRLRSPFAATRSIRRIVSSGRVMFSRRCMALVPLGVNVVYTHRVWMARTTRAERTERRKPLPLSSNERGAAAGRQGTRSARLPGAIRSRSTGSRSGATTLRGRGGMLRRRWRSDCSNETRHRRRRNQRHSASL